MIALSRYSAPRAARRRWLLAALAPLFVACSDGEFSFGSKKPPPPEPAPEPIASVDPLRRGTVGELALLSNLSPRTVRGFGLVVGLEGAGSRDCAASIRKYLVDRLLKLDPQQQEYFAEAAESINELINSPNTAVVELTGAVPPGALPMSTFDVAVSAATATQTRSLAGGLLLPAELKIVGVATSGRGILAGRTVASVAGPVFTSPFAGESEGTALSDPRRGLVLGGGLVRTENYGKLVLKEPSSTVCRRIGQRINERFGPEPPTAEAMSQSYLHIHTPPAFADAPLLFSRLIAHVYMRNDPPFFDAKLRELNDYAAAPGADYAELALAWEGIGPLALPHVRGWYAADDDALAYFAAQAGLRLSDTGAVAALSAVAADADHPYRLHAVRALADSRLARSDAALLPMLDDADPEVRVAACAGLTQRGHPAVKTYHIRHRLDKNYVNFKLDVVRSSGSPLIHVRRSGEPRIAVFGQDLALAPLVFYNQPARRLTIHSDVGEEEATVMGKVLRDGPRETFHIPPAVSNLIFTLGARPERDADGDLVGLGMCYSEVVGVLARLSEQGSLPAPVMFERVALRALFDPAEIGGRREAELPDAPPADRSDGDPADEAAIE